jgi:hypothetical protein
MKITKEIQKSLKSVLNDKYVLYVVAFIAVTQLLAYLGTQNFNALLVFLLSGFITSYFTKNMNVILLVAIISSNVFHLSYSIKEGMENKKADAKAKSQTEGDDEAEIDEEGEEDVVAAEEKEASDDEDDESDTDKHSTKSTPQKVKGKTTPKSEQEDDSINLQKTIMESYENANKMMGGANFKQMSADAKQLMQQQKELAGHMEKIGPMMDQAKGMLDSLGLGNLMGGQKKKGQ